MKGLIIKVLIMIALCVTIILCASSCGSHRIINIYSLDGQLIATYEGKISIRNNINGKKVVLELDGKSYIYYSAIVEVIEK